MNLILIENSLKSVSDYILDNTDFIIFSKDQNYENLLSNLTGKLYDNIGIFSHGNSFSFNFIEDVIATSENTQFINFLYELKIITDFKNLDLFSCNFGSNNDFINKLENELKVNVRASTNNTGNMPFGDWIMETDNINIKEIYFNDNISNFKGVLLLALYKSSYIISNNINNGKNIIYPNYGSFAALRDDGSVVTWGHENNGGNSSVSTQLSSGDYIYTPVSNHQLSSGVSKIYSTQFAFAALKENGSVVTWGNSGDGGDSSDVSVELSSGVSKIYSNYSAFAALKNNGSVVTWGKRNYGANGEVSTYKYPVGYTYESVSPKLESGVSKIYSTQFAFAALKDDGSVVTWGNSTFGGDSSSLDSGDLSSGVSKIYSTNSAFAALKENGSVVTWGHSNYGGGSSSLDSGDLSSGVSKIYSSAKAFAALKENGSVVTWGSGGTMPQDVSPKLSSGVSKIYSTNGAFAALKDDGSVVTWGNEFHGGNSSDVSTQLSSGVSKIYSNYYAFAALKDDGSVVTWGHNSYGGKSSVAKYNNGYTYESVSPKLESGVSKIYSSYGGAFAALKENGSVVTWGNEFHGGNSSDVSTQLSSGVSKIYSTDSAFTALKDDGSVVTWGKDYGTNGVIPEVIAPPEWLKLNSEGYDTTHLKNDQVYDKYILLDYPSLAALPVPTVPPVPHVPVPHVPTVPPVPHVPVPHVPTVTGSGSGDPYIYPINGNVYKMPNNVAFYRFLEFDDVIINVDITNLTKQEKEIIIDVSKEFNIHNPEVNGVYFNQFFIKIKDEYVLVDRYLNVISTNIDTSSSITITPNDKEQMFHCPIQGISSYTSLEIKSDDIFIDLHKYSNPQMINGIVVHLNKNKQIYGLMASDTNPRYSRIKQITNTHHLKAVSCHKQYKKIFNENWVKIKT